jgi:membrane protein required for colicin V production
MKLDPVEISDDINKTIDKGAEIIQNNITQTVKDSTIQMIEDVNKTIEESIKLNPNKENN